jgi:hypothetical protein
LLIFTNVTRIVADRYDYALDVPVPLSGLPDNIRCVATDSMLQGPLVAESGSQNFVFPAILMSALPPEAAIELIGW